MQVEMGRETIENGWSLAGGSASLVEDEGLKRQAQGCNPRCPESFLGSGWESF
jgi:hypothetical protein